MTAPINQEELREEVRLVIIRPTGNQVSNNMLDEIVELIATHDRQLLAEAFAAVRPETIPNIDGVADQWEHGHNTALEKFDTNTAKYLKELE